MDKSKGEPVISVKAKSKERVRKRKLPPYKMALKYTVVIYMPAEKVAILRHLSLSPLQETKSRDRKSPSKEKKEILSFDQIKEQREKERQRQREREVREVERRRFT